MNQARPVTSSENDIYANPPDIAELELEPGHVVIGYGAYRAVSYVAEGPGFGEVGHALLLGLVTFARVVVLVVVATLVWVPIGVWIGLNPRYPGSRSRSCRCWRASPRTSCSPFATPRSWRPGISLNLGGILLMASARSGTSCSTSIAGASAIPTDLREAAANLRLPRIAAVARLILPAIFPSYVTGGITAAGGAWNASIVAEIVTYGGTTLTAPGSAPTSPRPPRRRLPVASSSVSPS